MFARDDRHAAARELIDQGLGRVVTSELVLGETWTLLCRRLGHHSAIKFLDYVNEASVEVAGVSQENIHSAWTWVRRHSERLYSFVDATSFAIMRQRRI